MSVGCFSARGTSSTGPQHQVPAAAVHLRQLQAMQAKQQSVCTLPYDCSCCALWQCKSRHDDRQGSSWAVAQALPDCITQPQSAASSTHLKRSAASAALRCRRASASAAALARAVHAAASLSRSLLPGSCAAIASGLAPLKLALPPPPPAAAADACAPGGGLQQAVVTPVCYLTWPLLALA